MSIRGREGDCDAMTSLLDPCVAYCIYCILHKISNSNPFENLLFLKIERLNKISHHILSPIALRFFTWIVNLSLQQWCQTNTKKLAPIWIELSINIFIHNSYKNILCFYFLMNFSFIQRLLVCVLLCFTLILFFVTINVWEILERRFIPHNQNTSHL